MRRIFLGVTLLLLLVAVGCLKEKSFEVSNKPSVGSLQSDVSGDCLPKTINGTYVAATPLVAATNTITISVNVTETGNYTIYTDTLNGYFFRATGVFTTLGANTVTLRSSGTPFSAGINNFIITYGTSTCDIAITVLPVGSSPAVFTLQSTAGSCGGAVINGSYATGNDLNFTNTVVLNVDVTTIGTYTVTTGPTAVNGMIFSGSGSFTATGVKQITLTGVGKPVSNGNSTVPVTVGTSTCSFVIPVGNPAVGTLGATAGACTPATINGTYTINTALVTTNSVDIQVNVTTLGVYSITTNTVAGISFAASGSFTTLGAQSLKLNGTGTPTASGLQTFTITFGTSTCTFAIDIVGPPLSNDYYPRTTGSNWSYEFDDDPDDSLYRNVIAPTLSAQGNVYNILMQKDETGTDSSGYFRKSGGDYFEWLDIGDYFGFQPPPQWGSYIFLKDNVTVGTTWTSGAFTGNINLPPVTPFTLRVKNTILQKDVPISFTTSKGTMNFTNVIVVEETAQALVGATWQDVTNLSGSIKAYYAKGIGLIKFEFFDGTGTLSGIVELRRYQVL